MEGEKPVKEILSKDITLRIFSIFIAIILWLYVVDIQNPKTEILIKDIPVQYINTEAIDDLGLMIMNEESQTVTLKISGRRKTLAGLNSRNIKAVADVRGLNKTGEQPVMIQVSMPTEGIDIIEKKPYNVMVELDKMIQVQKEVTVVRQGTVKEQYIAFAPQVKPNIVTLKAPSSIINAIGSVRVAVDVSGHNKDIVSQQKYEIYNKNNEKINSSNVIADVDTVEVIYPIRKMRDIPVIPRIEGSPAQDHIVTNTEVIPETIKIVGKREVVDNTVQIFTEPIDIENIDTDVESDIPLHLDEGLRLYTSGNTVKVKIEVEKQVTRTVAVDSIKVYNVPEDLSYQLITENLDVKLKGIESKMSRVKSDDIYASVDVYALEEGTHEVPVRIIAASDIEVVDGYAATVKLFKQSEEEQPAEPDETDGDRSQDNAGDGETDSEENADLAR